MAQIMTGSIGRLPVRTSIDAIRSLLDAAIYQEAVRDSAAKTGEGEGEADRRVVECLRYLYLISACPKALGGLFLPVEQPIDEVWHFLILQTREYRELCETRLPGRFFIEHRSMPYAAYRKTPSREALVEQALRWIPLYCATFGPFDEPGARHWTMVRFLREQMGLSLAQIAALDGAHPD
jgi:hypothetical protein